MTDKGEAAAALGRRIETIRAERGLAIGELAARVDIDRSSLEAILRGDSGVEFFEFGRLAAALGVDPGELLDGIEWVPDGRGGGDYRVSEPEHRPVE